MKRFYTLLIVLVATSVTALAQTLDVKQGDITWRYSALDITSNMTFKGNQLEIAGRTYDLDGIKMNVNNKVAEQNTVDVTYTSAGATIIADARLADVMTIEINGGNVVVNTAETLADEITYRLQGVGESFTLNSDFKCAVVLNGVTLTSKGTTPAVYIHDGKRIDIIANENTNNSFSDCAQNESKSAFYVKGHAEWKGGGTVNISGVAKHAYSSNEYTLLKASFTGTLNILRAASDGMHIDQYFQMNGGTLNISNTTGDGVDVAYALEDDEVTPTTDEMNGQIIIKGGVINVDMEQDDTKGLKCEDIMTIMGGNISAIANGDGSRGIQSSNTIYVGTEGSTDVAAPYILLLASGDDYTDPTGDVNKCRGMKTKKDLYLYSGTIKRDANSAVKAKKIIDVDGTFYKLNGVLDGITIE